MPRSEPLNRKMREESRARIVGAALEVFAGHGYGGASMRRIAERAGVSPGLIYAYFPGKEALVLAILELGMEDVRASFAAAMAEREPRRRVRRLVEASFELIRERRDFWRLSYGVRLQAAAVPAVAPAVAVWTGEIVGVLTRLLREAGVPGAPTEARLLFASIDGVAQHFVLDPAGYPLDDVIARLLERYDLEGQGAAGLK